MNDEGFREIQLNGKQLVFLVMAATVVAVVIFLFGVMVGRGVRGTGSSVEMASTDVGPDPTQPGTTPAPETSVPPVAASSPSSGTPSGAVEAAQPAEELSYAERLLRDAPAEEKLKQAPAARPGAPRAPAPAVQEQVPAPPPAAPRPAPPAPRAASPPPTPAPVTPLTSSDPSGPGFAVQVSIFETRQEADRLANQLVAKGYPAFVLDPIKGAGKPIYRVRVGKYRNRKDAEEIQARLEKNEQFTPWIAR